MSCLITGHNGLLGPYVIKSLQGKIDIYTCSRSAGDYRMDLTDESSVARLCKKIKPNLIIHCAAFTDVDEAEQNPSNAYSVNQHATKNIIKNISSDSHFIYISTDQVYPDTEGLHKEGEENPINVYGKSKWKGALEAKKHQKTTIVHTNMIGSSLSKKRKSFSDVIIESLKKGDHFKLFSDSFFSPLHFETISHILNHIIESGIIGIYNLGSREGMSKEDFILNMSKHLSLSSSNTESILSGSILNRARRAHDLRMNVQKLQKVLKFSMPTLMEEIKKL